MTVLVVEAIGFISFEAMNVALLNSHDLVPFFKV